VWGAPGPGLNRRSSSRSVPSRNSSHDAQRAESVSLLLTRRSNVACVNVRSAQHATRKSCCAGDRRCALPTRLRVWISTRSRRLSWSVCIPVWCVSHRWTKPRSLPWLSTCLPRKSPARADYGLLACERFVERLSSCISSARPWPFGSAASTHLWLTTPFAIPHECRACAATSCYFSRRSMRGGWHPRERGTPARAVVGGWSGTYRGGTTCSSRIPSAFRPCMPAVMAQALRATYAPPRPASAARGRRVSRLP
jgi:hypothetical protein